MKILVSCGTKFHSDHIGYQLQKRGILSKVITSHPSMAYKRVELEKENIFFLPPIFIFSLLLRKILGKWYFFQSQFDWLLAVVYDWMASLCIPTETDISISWAWASLRTMRAVKRNGGIAILEECGSCNRHQDEILQEEYQKLNLEYVSSTFHKILSREIDECNEADYILCPSRYVMESFGKYGIPKSKFILIPYGVDLSLFSRQEKLDDIFRILFVGTIGVRKGLIYLFEALKLLTIEFECLIIGRIEPAFENIFKEHSSLFKHIGRVEHSQIKHYYSNSSVFVFPSIDEGMAYVQLEAMACGLPVICTPNSGGDSVIRDGEEGFIVPLRDPLAIKNRIEYLYHNPSELKKMSCNAETRSKQFTWERYGDELEMKLEQLVSEKSRNSYIS